MPGTLRLVFRFAPVHGEDAAMDGTPLRMRRPFCPQAIFIQRPLASYRRFP